MSWFLSYYIVGITPGNNYVAFWSKPPKTEVWRLSSKFFMANILFWEHLGVICFSHENQSFFVEKRISYIFPWTRHSLCQNRDNSLAENTPNALKTQPNLSAQVQKFWIFEKKLSLDVRSPCHQQSVKISLMQIKYRTKKSGCL